MIQKIDPVFGSWYTQNQIGSGTDGKVFCVKRDNSDGSCDISSLKIIRIGENKGDRKSVYQATTNFLNENDYYEKTIKSITDNIDIVMDTDAGKNFVMYEEYEKRKASDGKGWLILIRLQRMKSLTELLQEFSFTHDEVVRVGISICQSLIKCRTFGYIYPNLKPENVLFDKDGICKLGDFGTFSLLEPSRAAIAYKRTQYYMAPEFIKTGKVNCTVDTYSLGLILYMLVNRNRLPFVEPYPQNITVHSLNQSTQKRLDGVDLPKPLLASEELERIINKACNSKETKRYLSPKQMLTDLKKLINTDENHKESMHEQSEDDIEQIQQNLTSQVQTKFVSTEQDIQKLYSDENPNIANQDVKLKAQQENIHQQNVLEPKQEQQPQPPPPEEDPISLIDEIGIPDISSNTYHIPKDKKEPVSNFVKLPKIKKEVTHANQDKKKVIILIIIAVLFLVLFALSCYFYISSNDNQSELLLVLKSTIYNYERYGGLKWLMI